MGAILRRVLPMPRFIESTIGDTPVRVAYRVLRGEAQTDTDPGSRPCAELLYAVLKPHIIELSTFDSRDVALWQDAADDAVMSWEQDEAAERAEARMALRRDDALAGAVA